MKTKNYERSLIVTILTISIIVIEACLFICFYNRKITEYFEISTIVVDKNEVRVIVDNAERKTLYNNSILYIDDHKSTYSIQLDNGVLWQKNKTKYYEMILKVKLKKEYHYNDIVTVSLAKEKKI